MQSQAIKVNSSGKVGINGNTSSYPLRVNGSLEVTSSISFNSGSSNNISYVDKIFNYMQNGYLEFPTSSSTTLKINSYYSSRALDISGQLWVNGNQVTGSDQRLKKDIQPLNGLSVLDKLGHLEGKKYKFKEYGELLALHNKDEVRFSTDTFDLFDLAQQLAALDPDYSNKSEKMSAKEQRQYIKTNYLEKAGKKLPQHTMLNDTMALVINAPRYNSKETFGFLAQDVLQQFPELVALDSVSGLYGVNYDGFVPLLLEGLKEATHRIETLEKTLEKVLEKEKLK